MNLFQIGSVNEKSRVVVPGFFSPSLMVRLDGGGGDADQGLDNVARQRLDDSHGVGLGLGDAAHLDAGGQAENRGGDWLMPRHALP